MKRDDELAGDAIAGHLPAPQMSADIVAGVTTNRVEVRRPRRKRSAEKTWEVVCISLYPADLERIDATVAALRERGITNASRSWLLRFCAAKANVDDIVAELSKPGRR